MVNKYEKDMTEIRLNKVLKYYTRKDEIEGVYTTVNSYREDLDKIESSITKLDNKISNNELNTKAMFDKIILCLKITFTLLFILVIFGILLVVSYFKLESRVDENIKDTSSINITYDYGV